ncbi:putative transmembrane protein [Sulfuriferula multivorans]|uniref:Putative transmembrane protein n=1 Tax=Sulfuriferula multivorans TaxID=1559896 RepID=A0A401JH86_9PROT|nr:anti-sigma factor [Sulfuriferula multivorans]GBL47345.1 putative transmembrane protein [Sulfuriferula multivorans]
MDCKRTLELLPAHLDQELGLPESREMDQHLQTCAACHNAFASQSALRDAVKQRATYFQAPIDLESRIRAALPLEPEIAAATAKRRPWQWGSWNWLNAGTMLASLVVLVWSAGLYLATPSPNELLAEEVVSSHVRSLMVNHLADVASSDQHTVKPWFDGKLDFSPPVADLTAQGFPLVGGRLDYLDHRSVAALVYRHRLHLINVYIWPAANERQTALHNLSIQGYHLLHWSEAGMVYWMISDLNPHDLMTLTRILQAQAQRTPS